VDGLQGTLESGGRAQFLQGEIILPGQQRPDLVVVGRDDHRLASGEVMPSGDVARAAALLQEFLDHSQGDSETVGHLGASAFVLVIGAKDALPDIHR
jgi:hypothetical protein